MNLSILLALVTTTTALSPRCFEYCRWKFSRQLSLPWDPQCNYCAEEYEIAPMFKATSVLTLRENRIYYEPSELYPIKSITYFEQPFYFINPTVKVKAKFTREKKTIKHVRNDEILLEELNTGKHEYLDVIVGEKSIDGKSSGQTSHSSEYLHQMEKTLSHCVDLHILSLSRKHNNVSTLLKLWRANKFQMLNDLSNSDLIKAIENKCREPEKYITSSLGEIINKWPKRPKRPVTSTSNYGNGDLYLLKSTKSQTMSENVYSDFNTVETIAASTKNKTRNHPNIKVMHRRVPAETVEARKLENVEDHVSNSYLGKALSARSADETHNTPVKSDFLLPLPFSTVTDGFNITQINEIVINKSEDKDLINSTNVSSTEKQIFDIAKKASVNLGSWEESKGYTSHSNKNDKFTREQNSLETFRDDLKHQGFRNTSLNIVASYLLSKKHSTSNQNDLSTVSHNNNSENIINNTILGNVKNPTFLSKSHYEDKDKNIIITYAKIYKKIFNESEIPLQKIITREFANNTVVSVTNGNEDVRNNDFLYSSNEDITPPSISSLETEGESNHTNDNLTEALVKNIKKSQNESKANTELVIRGRLYFILGQEHIPARFVQKSDGELHVGIDGQTICMKLNKEEDKKFKILAALCNPSS
ncbi:unnamed protein product [Parnassius apollo]|uniref:(apollo) hypothetical protein n=1 Tax=Parnassius apollo TaxID=110799 RepID=A0A8S3XA47_PARAO|nr:unnamed protein product [Parnassius apollo]